MYKLYSHNDCGDNFELAGTYITVEGIRHNPFAATIDVFCEPHQAGEVAKAMSLSDQFESVNITTEARIRASYENGCLVTEQKEYPYSDHDSEGRRVWDSIVV